MAHFAQLMATDGKEIFVNMDEVIQIRPLEGKTALMFSNGKALEVTQSALEILERANLRKTFAQAAAS